MPPARAADAPAPEAAPAASAPLAHARVVSHTPGRLRLRVQQADRPRLGRLQTALQEVPGVTSVATNATTGSLLVQYHHRGLSREDVRAALADIGLIVHKLQEGPDLADAGPSTTAGSLMDAVGDLDRRLSRLTSARVDLKLLFPLALGALGLRQTLTEGLGLNQLPGWVLLWYAFDSFWKFHGERGRSGRPASPDDGRQ